MFQELKVESDTNMKKKTWTDLFPKDSLASLNASEFALVAAFFFVFVSSIKCEDIRTKALQNEFRRGREWGIWRSLP